MTKYTYVTLASVSTLLKPLSGFDYIADGIRLGISATLTQLSGLFLVHAPALNAYRGKNLPAPSVGAMVSVRVALTCPSSLRSRRT